MEDFTPAEERAARLGPAERRLHHAILRAFPDFGGPPRAEWLAEQARAAGLDPVTALAALVEADVIQVEAGTGAIVAAYPFSGVATPHRVAVDGARPVHAMCAIDALGIPFMLGADATVTSEDPLSGAPIRITVRGGEATWEPAAACMFVGTVGEDGPLSQRLCRTVNFFASPESAGRYAAARPEVSGRVLDQDAALRAGIRSFGGLLSDEDGGLCTATRCCS